MCKRKRDLVRLEFWKSKHNLDFCWALLGISYRQHHKGTYICKGDDTANRKQAFVYHVVPISTKPAKAI